MFLLEMEKLAVERSWLPPISWIAELPPPRFFSAETLRLGPLTDIDPVNRLLSPLSVSRLPPGTLSSPEPLIEPAKFCALSLETNIFVMAALVHERAGT